MSSTELTSYASRIQEINRLTGLLQSCDDVEEAIKIYESAEAHLRECERTLESAKGRYEEIIQNRPNDDKKES